MNTLLISLLIGRLIAADPSLLGQSNQKDAPSTPKYQIRVILGDGARNVVKKGRATSRAVVEVRDENDLPVGPGILVTFMLPSTGPSGTFVNGGISTTVATDATGKAGVTFTPNSVAGQLNLTASIPGQAAAVTIAQTVAISTAAISATALAGIIAGVAAAGAGVAVTMSRSGGDSQASNRVRSASIGGPAGPVFGPPR